MKKFRVFFHFLKFNFFTEIYFYIYHCIFIKICKKYLKLLQLFYNFFNDENYTKIFILKKGREMLEFFLSCYVKNSDIENDHIFFDMKKRYFFAW